MSCKSLFVSVMVSIPLALGGCATFHPRPLSPEKTVAAFSDRSLNGPGLCAFLEKNRVPAPIPGRAWTLKPLTLAAFYYQPSLAEARAQLLAANAARITAGERPNPSISVNPAYDSAIPGNFSPWIVPVSLDWPIETAGKRGYRLQQARQLDLVARWNLCGALWGVRSGVRAALLELYAARRQASLLAREIKARKKVVRMLEGQVSAGYLSSYEVTRARIDLDKTILAGQAAAGRVLQARVALAGTLGVSVRALENISLSFAGFKTFPRQLTRPRVQRWALLNRADVRSALADYAVSQSALQLQIATQYPDIHIGPGYAWNNGNAGDNQWSLGLTLTLPVLNRNEGQIAQAKANRKLAAAHFLTVQTAALTSIDSALAGYCSALSEVETAEGLLKNLRRRLVSVRAQVRAGEIEPLSLANAEVAYSAGAMDRLNALIQAQQALGRLEDAVQSPLTLSPSKLAAAQTVPTPNEDLKK